MLQFVVGLIIGGIVGFGTCAFLCVANDDMRTEGTCREKTGENDVRDE